MSVSRVYINTADKFLRQNKNLTYKIWRKIEIESSTKCVTQYNIPPECIIKKWFKIILNLLILPKVSLIYDGILVMILTTA